jgi:hypothetical protein
MFSDNGEAFKKLAGNQIEVAMRMFTGVMENMEPEALLRMGQHMEKGARLAVTVLAPDEGVFTVELSMVHPEAGALLLHSASLSVVPPPAQRH